MGVWWKRLGGNPLSANPKAAVEAVRYLLSSDVQRRRLVDIASAPSRTALLRDPTLLQNTGFNGWLSEHWQEGMFARPSAQTGKRYNAISRAYSKAVHDVVAGKKDAGLALAQLHAELISIMSGPFAATTK